MAADSSGVVHLVWKEADEGGATWFDYASLSNGVWSNPVDVLYSNSYSASPSLQVDDRGYLHLIWRGDGLEYSQVHASQAMLARAWSKPRRISLGLAANQPDLAIDETGVLHAVFAVQYGRQSGIYYLRSEDHGLSWGEPLAVFTNMTGDLAVDHARLAVARDGRIAVVWTEYSYPELFPPLGVRFAEGDAAADQWTEPVYLTEGPYDWPGVTYDAADGVHVVWSGTAEDRFKFHRWRSPSTGEWSEIWRNVDLRGFQGFPDLAVDSAGVLHWVQAGQLENRADAIYHNAWSGSGWSPGEVLLTDDVSGMNPMSVSAVMALGDQIHVAAAVPVDDGFGGWQMEVFHVFKKLAAEGLPPRPVPTHTPESKLVSSTAAEDSAARATATPAEFDRLAPLDGSLESPVVSYAPMVFGLLPAALVVFAAVVVAGRRRRQ